MSGGEPDGRPQLDLVFARRGDRTVIDRRLFRWPFVLTRTFTLDRAPAHMLTVIVQTGSGAIHGEDRLAQRLRVQAGAAAHVTTQGATAVHRAEAESATQDTVALAVEEGGFLEYWPEPRILFPGAALEQAVDIDCTPGGVVLAADAFTTHDPEGLGRSFRRFVSTTTLRCGGEPVLVDRFDLRTPGRGRTAGFAAYGSVLLAAPGRPDGLDALAERLSATLAGLGDLYGAASLLPAEGTGLGVRLVGRDLRAVRAGLHAVWVGVRRHLTGADPPSRRKGDDLGPKLACAVAPGNRTVG